MEKKLTVEIVVTETSTSFTAKSDSEFKIHEIVGLLGMAQSKYLKELNWIEGPSPNKKKK